MGRYVNTARDVDNNGAGDVNEDGTADVIAGAPWYDHPEENEGRAFVYHGQPDPIAGLSATNDSPTILGELTTLSATITSGTAVSYTWNFGDEFMGSEAVVTHTYEAPGVYTATVTASNSVNMDTAMTTVTIDYSHVYIYLPVVLKSLP